jgi:hypothetical protein
LANPNNRLLYLSKKQTENKNQWLELTNFHKSIHAP